jgi:hypothetical protein
MASTTLSPACLSQVLRPTLSKSWPCPILPASVAADQLPEETDCSYGIAIASRSVLSAFFWGNRTSFLGYIKILGLARGKKCPVATLDHQYAPSGQDSFYFEWHGLRSNIILDIGGICKVSVGRTLY